MFTKRSYDETNALVAQIDVGKYVFIYNGPDRWAIHRADSRPKDPSGYTIFMIDTDYRAPGWAERVEIYYDDERASEPVCDTHGVLAVMDTEEEANALAERLQAAYKTYLEEIAAPVLKMDMAVGIALSQ